MEAADGDVIGWIALPPQDSQQLVADLLEPQPFTTEIVLERGAPLMIINAFQASGA